MMEKITSVIIGGIAGLVLGVAIPPTTRYVHSQTDQFNYYSNFLEQNKEDSVKDPGYCIFVNYMHNSSTKKGLSYLGTRLATKKYLPLCDKRS